MGRKTVLRFAIKIPPLPGQEARSWLSVFATFDFARSLALARSRGPDFFSLDKPEKKRS